jgi:hypothetical protein
MGGPGSQNQGAAGTRNLVGRLYQKEAWFWINVSPEFLVLRTPLQEGVPPAMKKGESCCNSAL